jgi:hypothetical protein
VQGDKSNQGELFGINNIFKLHEGGLTTKMAVGPCGGAPDSASSDESYFFY